MSLVTANGVLRPRWRRYLLVFLANLSGLDDFDAVFVVPEDSDPPYNSKYSEKRGRFPLRQHPVSVNEIATISQCFRATSQSPERSERVGAGRGLSIGRQPTELDG